VVEAKRPTIYDQRVTANASAEVESAWAAEIDRRAAEARQNPADDEDWRTALAEIQRELTHSS
jgi:hypothetical protein